MKSFNLLSLATVPAICTLLTSCSRDAEDYVREIATIYNEAADLLANATSANADEIADDLNELVEELNALHEEMKEDEDELKQKEKCMSRKEKIEFMKPMMEASIKLEAAIQKATNNGVLNNTKLKKAVKAIRTAKPS
jgi:hypothetical protein